jgi:hypothetical protein
MHNKKSEIREALREEFWPNEKAWTGVNRKGWFRAPRTMPLLLELLRQKKIHKGKDPSTTYLALWAQHYDGGVIEITNETEMAYSAGYDTTRAVRTWRERMGLLEELGFIKSKAASGQKYRYVLLVEPAHAVKALRQKRLVDEQWHATYQALRLHTRERVTRAKPASAATVVPITASATK